VLVGGVLELVEHVRRGVGLDLERPVDPLDGRRVGHAEGAAHVDASGTSSAIEQRTRLPSFSRPTMPASASTPMCLAAMVGVPWRLVRPRPSPSSPDVDASHAFSAIHAELTRLRAGLTRIDEAVSALEREHRPSAPVRERPVRYLRVLVAVYDIGGRLGVDAETFAAIGAEHGYNRRGLGGFFTGTRAPLRRSEGRIMVTPQGEYLIDLYLHQLEA
jgi:hypothetical protein